MSKKYLNKNLKNFSLSLFALVTLVVISAARINYFEINKQLDIFANVFREVNTFYVDNTEPGDLMNDAVEHMLKELDPYTVYIPEADIENYRIMQTGQYGGVGASITKHQDYVVISSIRKGFAADKGGLKVGDKIILVEKKEMKGKSPTEISNILKGSPGTLVEMTFERNGEQKTVSLERENIQLKSVPFYGMLNQNTGYVVLSSFTQKASADVQEAIENLKKENNLTQMVFDLRGNPGGLLSEAVNVTNLFVEKGQTVVETKGRAEKTNMVYKTLRKPLEVEMPIVVLIDGNSASASEIVAGTLQDLDRGIILGQRSFGKGLVQQTRPLSYGSQLKITIAKYYTPSGRCIQAINYAQRDEDGGVVKIPDSLRNEFTTANGRSVFDGGGIDPDIDFEAKKYPSILQSLILNNLIFDFSVEYLQRKKSIAAPGLFELTNQDYKDFISFISDKEYSYKTKTEKTFDALMQATKKEDYVEMNAEIEALKLKFEKHKQEDLMRFKKEIKAYLEEEIVSHLYYDEGRIEQTIKTDAEVAKAIEVLNDKIKYNQLLTVAK